MYQKVVSLISLREKEKEIKQKMKSKALLIKKIYYLKYISYKAAKGIELCFDLSTSSLRI